MAIELQNLNVLLVQVLWVAWIFLPVVVAALWLLLGSQHTAISVYPLS